MKETGQRPATLTSGAEGSPGGGTVPSMLEGQQRGFVAGGPCEMARGELGAEVTGSRGVQGSCLPPNTGTTGGL